MVHRRAIPLNCDARALFVPGQLQRLGRVVCGDQSSAEFPATFGYILPMTNATPHSDSSLHARTVPVSRVRALVRRPVLYVALVAISVTAILGLPAAALGHVPTVEGTQGFEDNVGGDAETQIGGPEKSRAVYGYLKDGVDRYAFRATEPVARTIGVIVPAYKEHATFYPTMVLEEDGIEVARSDDAALAERTGEFEPFSLTTFWDSAELVYDFEPGHDYLVRIEPGQSGATSGRYVLVVGGPEAFSGSDIAETLRGLPRIWFGAYGGAPFRFNPLALIPFSIVAGILGLLGTLIVRMLRRRAQSTR